METLLHYFMINPVFYIFAALSVILAILMLTVKNPVYSAIFLIKTFFCLAVIYITLEAEFIAAIQIIVYTGAIMVLFLFVVMLLNLESESTVKEPYGPMAYLTVILAFVILIQIGSAAKLSFPVGEKGMYPIEVIRAAGNVETLATVLFSQYLYPFEIASVVLLLGMIGALLIAKRKFD